MTNCIFYFVIFVHSLSTVHLLTTGPPDEFMPEVGPGKAGCWAWGEQQYNCNVTDVPIENFPKECTSFFYDGIRIDMNHTLTDLTEDMTGIPEYLDKLIATNKKVYIHYAHADEMDWIKALEVSADEIENFAKKDTESVKAYLDEHPGVSGLLFVKLNRHELYKLTENVKKYIEVMKTGVPGLEIGLNIDCVTPIFYINHPDKKWLDFKMICDSFDFYVMNLYAGDFNPCTKEFVKTGVFPLTGDPEKMNTTDTVTNYIKCEMGVPQSKLHYGYQTSAVLADPKADFCTWYYPYICKQKIKTDNTGYCVDTQQSLYEKGEYAFINGAGFVIDTIDTDDADCSCQCGRSFPAFYALLDGFNGQPPPPACPLFDRT